MDSEDTEGVDDPQFRAVVRLRNNRFVRARQDKGWSQADLALVADVGHNVVCAYENLRCSPWRHDGHEFKSSALALVLALEVDPSTLWADVGDVTSTTRVVEFDRVEDAPWLEAPQTPLEALEAADERAHYESALATLRPMKRRVLEWRLEGWTLDAIGAQYNLSRERIRCLCLEAAQDLKDALEADDAKTRRTHTENRRLMRERGQWWSDEHQRFLQVYGP